MPGRVDVTLLSPRPEVPAVAEYRALRAACGLSAKSREAAALGLPNSLYAVTVRDDAVLVGMGRIVGDGGCNFEVVDVAVHPNYQRQGLGGRIMAALATWLDANAPTSAYVSLIADDHSPALYARYGFRPTAPKSIGMGFIVRQTKKSPR